MNDEKNTGGVDDVAEPSEPVEADLPEQTPPPDYEPQPELADGQDPGVQERPADDPDEVDEAVGEDEAAADGNDDEAEDGDAGDEHDND